MLSLCANRLLEIYRIVLLSVILLESWGKVCLSFHIPHSRMASNRDWSGVQIIYCQTFREEAFGRSHIIYVDYKMVYKGRYRADLEMRAKRWATR